MGSAFNPALSRAGPLAAVDSMPQQEFDFSFSSAPRLSPLNLAPPKAASLTPLLGVAATPLATVFASAQPAGPDEAMLQAPQKPQAISTPVFEGTRLFKLGKLDRGKARLVKKAGQNRTKVPPAPVHHSVRHMFPQSPQVEGGFNSLLMGGRQLAGAFEEPAAAAPGKLLQLVAWSSLLQLQTASPSFAAHNTMQSLFKPALFIALSVCTWFCPTWREENDSFFLVDYWLLAWHFCTECTTWVVRCSALVQLQHYACIEFAEHLSSLPVLDIAQLMLQVTCTE